MRWPSRSSNRVTVWLFVLWLAGCGRTDNPNTGQKTAEQTRTESLQTADARGDDMTNSLGMRFRLIPAGSFRMGSPNGEGGRMGDEGPRHRVTLTRPFYLGVFEVTQEQYETVMGVSPSCFKGDALPVETVKWADAREFCRKLSQREKNTTYRLPTEAEWEYACRAGRETAFYWGKIFDVKTDGKFAWISFRNHYKQKTREVGTLEPNAWGLYDMTGNVGEWCEDWYGKYSADEQVDPKGPDSGPGRVFRGGAWDDYPRDSRSAFRNCYKNTSDYCGSSIGFRVVAVPVVGP